MELVLKKCYLFKLTINSKIFEKQRKLKRSPANKHSISIQTLIFANTNKTMMTASARIAEISTRQSVTVESVAHEQARIYHNVQ